MVSDEQTSQLLKDRASVLPASSDFCHQLHTFKGRVKYCLA